ncbi:MAG: ATP-binding cassette domain-containing protein, partial [Erysipelotrichales bacterium]
MSNIEIRNMSFSYDNHHEMIFDDVTLNINTNWRLGLIGTNGKGKTTLLRILMGELEPSGIVNHQTKFQYFPFDVDGAMIVKDVIETINIDVQEWEIERELNLLDVNLDVIDRPFSSLSNGEQTKVMLVALFLQDNVFLLIDEPTNHLDIDSRKTLANYLKMKKGFILVSHDRRLLNEVVNHVISINKSSVDLLKGNY